MQTTAIDREAGPIRLTTGVFAERPALDPAREVVAMLLQALYSIRSERQLVERLEFDLLFRWFVGIGVDDVAWDHSTFSKNRERLLERAGPANLDRSISGFSA